MTPPAHWVASKSEFAKIFSASGPVHIVRAPGRVNLIGEHTDYNDGFVFPMAIEAQVTAVYRKRSDTTVRIASTGFPGQFVEFSLRQPITKGMPKWGD